MIRLSKLTDYAIVLLTHMAAKPQDIHSASALAESASIPLPTVSKVLKTLCKHKLVASHRGQRGGYALAQEPTEMSVVAIIEAMEGPVALTDCATDVKGDCSHEGTCVVQDHWRVINAAVTEALSHLTLAHMHAPASTSLLTRVRVDAPLKVVKEPCPQ